MFVVQGVFETLHSPDIVRHHDELYNSLLYDAPGMRINQYLRGMEDTNSQLHFMAWEQQADSEAFGVSDAFQQLRKASPPPDERGPRSRMAHRLSPGYWNLVVNEVPGPRPTGLTGDLGQALHQMVAVHAGKEQAFETLIRDGDGITSLPGYQGRRLLQNLGNPHEFALYVYLADDVAPSTIEAIRNTIAPFAASVTGGMYRVELSTEFTA